MIAFGFDHPDEIEFIDATWFAQTGMSIEALESRAFGNVWAITLSAVATRNQLFVPISGS